MGCNVLERADNQPEGIVEYATADDVNIMGINIPTKDTIIPQHSHEYDHTTLVAAGKIRAWADDELLGDYEASKMLFIKAGTKHTFVTLEDNTIIYCIHNISRKGVVEVKEEHQIVGDESCQ